MVNSKKKQKSVYLISGIPASGKSTYIKNNLILSDKDIHISRDMIRFSLLNEDDNYFDKENIVFKNFVSEINKSIEDVNIENIYIDATHINEKSRLKVINKINLNNNCNLISIYFDTPYEICIKRNAKREGLENVPESALKRMFNDLTPPWLDKNIEYDKFIDIITDLDENIIEAEIILERKEEKE